MYCNVLEQLILHDLLLFLEFYFGHITITVQQFKGDNSNYDDSISDNLNSTSQITGI